MSSLSDANELVGFLDRVARAYPAGVPKRMVVVPQEALRPTRIRCVLLSLGTQTPLDARLDTLAQAIGAKGLRLPAAHYIVRSLSALTFGADELANLVHELSPEVVIICGGSHPSQTLDEVAGTLVVYSAALTQIADSAEVKRRFWQQLQGVLPRISGTITEG